MEVSSVNQARVFLWMVVCGGVCTLVFDIFRGVRRYKSAQCSVIMIQDLILWTIEICIVYLVAFKLNYAKIRAYEIVALIIGALLYFVLLSDLVVKGVCTVTAVVVRVATCMLTPVKKLFTLTIRPGINFLKKVLMSLRAKLKKTSAINNESAN